MNNVKQLVPPPINDSQPLNVDLWNFHMYYQKMHPALRFLLRSKLNEFVKNNGARIETIATEIGKIQSEQFEMKDGVVQTKQPLLDDKGAPVNPNEQPLPLYKENYNDKTFHDAFNKLMSLPTTIV